MKQEKFVGDTLPENPREHLQTFEDIFDGLYDEMDSNERYIDEIKSGLEGDNTYLGELLDLVSSGEADGEYYKKINMVKDSIVRSQGYLLDVLRAQNKIREYINILREMRSERDKKLTTLKDEQKN